MCFRDTSHQRLLNNYVGIWFKCKICILIAVEDIHNNLYPRVSNFLKPAVHYFPVGVLEVK